MSSEGAGVVLAPPSEHGLIRNGQGVRHHRAAALAGRYALALLLVALIVFFALYPPTSGTFLTTANVRNVLANEAVVAIAALAALLPLVCGEFDVSVGAVLGGASMVAATLTMQSGVSVGLGIVCALVLGAIVGVVSGFIIAYIRAGSFVITLGMATLIGGLVSLYSNDQTVTGPQTLIDFGNGTTLGVPRPVWLMVAAAAATGYLLRYTVFGRRLTLIGANARAAQLVGIRVARHVCIAFALAGVLAALAGLLQLARSGAASPQIGPGFTLSALAATFLGATTVKPGHFNVPGTIIGVFFVAVSVNGLTLAGAADWVDPVFNGAAVVIAVALASFLASRRGDHAKPI
jgi:ribose transport system permease protein